MARLSSTTGDGASSASASYSAAIRTQSVSSTLPARAWQAAIDACSPYGPSALPARSARSSAARPRRMRTWSQRPRSCSGSSTGSPDGDTRARSREAWISMSATRPCTSGSPGVSSARIRPSRSASWHRAGRTQSSPAVAE